MKLAPKLVVATLIVLVIASLAVWCFSTEAQSVTGRRYTVTFRFKQPNVPEPDTRIYVLVDAPNEGEGAIRAYKHLAEKLTMNAQEKLEFLEAQQKQ